jgi:hypothetical protein
MSSDQEHDSDTTDAQDDVTLTEKPEVTDKHREIAKEMRKEYEEDRPTVTMPGTDGAVSGTAVNDWIDDDGNPKFAKDGEGAAEQKEDA